MPRTCFVVAGDVVVVALLVIVFLLFPGAAIALPLVIGVSYPPVDQETIILLATALSGPAILLLLVVAFFIELRIRDRKHDSLKPHSRFCTLLSDSLVLLMTAAFSYVLWKSWALNKPVATAIRALALCTTTCSSLSAIWAVAGIITTFYNCGENGKMIRPGSALFETVERIDEWWQNFKSVEAPPYDISAFGLVEYNARFSAPSYVKTDFRHSDEEMLWRPYMSGVSSLATPVKAHLSPTVSDLHMLGR